MVSVPEAARRTGRNPETIRRWIRAGRLRSTRIGTQHMIEEADLDAIVAPAGGVEVPERWRRLDSGRPLPDVVGALDRSRRGR